MELIKRVRLLALTGGVALAGLSAVLLTDLTSTADAAAPCGMSVTGSMSGPTGSRWEFVTVRNCNSFTVKRRVTVSNFPDDVCETYGAGQTKSLTVMTAPFSSHATGLKAC